MTPAPEHNTSQGSFERLVTALEPWLDHVVIIGGWAHRLYRLHPHAQKLDYAPLSTFDTDIAVPPVLPVRESDIRQQLLAAGFTEEFLGSDKPPATHYLLKGELGGFYAEFLSPLTGSEYDRKDRRKATGRIAGVTSQRLRHIGILLDDPWEVAAGSRVVRIANPVRFLVQKILIHARRDAPDRGKDILYMHDTLELFGEQLEQLRTDWETRIAPGLLQRDASKVRKASGVLFGEMTDPIRDAARMAAGRDLRPESVRAACEFGFEALFR